MLNDKLRKQLPKPTEDTGSTSSEDQGGELCLCREESDPRNYWADEPTQDELQEAYMVETEVIDPWLDDDER